MVSMVPRPTENQIKLTGVGGSVTDEVDVGTLQLLGITISSHWDHALPQVLGLLGDEVAETGVNVTWGYGVDTSKVTPLVGKRLGHVNASSLCNIVAGLLLWEVGDVSGHGGGDDEGSSSSLLEVSSHSLCTVEGSVQVGLDDLIPGLDGALEDATVGGTTSVGDETVNLSELSNHVLDKLLDALVVSDITLVCLDLDTVGLGELLGVLLSAGGTRCICDGEVGSHLGAASCGFNSHTSWTGGTGNDDDLALEAEHVEEGIGLGD